MVKTLELKLKAFKETLLSLQTALKTRKTKIVRDSVIKRFEYSFELCWKTAKLYLLNQHGTNAFSPKEVFRELRKNQLITEIETELLLKMVNDRNEIIHTYNEKFSDELYKKIALKYFPAIEKVYFLLK